MYRTVTLLQSPFNNWYKWLIFSSLALVLLATIPFISALANECGGFVSELLLARSGTSSSTLTLERSGVGDSVLDVGMGAIVTTQAASNITTSAGRLNGNLTDLNNFPEADVYFEWGYTVAYGNVTSTQSLNAPGAFTADISGLSSDTTVHYRTVSELDGTYYGADQTFDTLDTGSPGGGSILGSSAAGTFIQTLIPIGIAVMVLVGVIKNAKSPMGVLIGTVIGLVTFFVAQIIIGIIW